MAQASTYQHEKQCHYKHCVFVADVHKRCTNNSVQLANYTRHRFHKRNPFLSSSPGRNVHFLQRSMFPIRRPAGKMAELASLHLPKDCHQVASGGGRFWHSPKKQHCAGKGACKSLHLWQNQQLRPVISGL